MSRPKNFAPSKRGSAPSLAEHLQQRARALEAEGQHIVHLQVGQPSTGAPRGTVEAVAAASQNESLGYTNAAGNLDLRGRIARQYSELYGASVDPDRVIITFGASGALILAILGLFDEGQRIGLPAPFYYGYRHALTALGVECVLFETSIANHFQPTIADLEAIEGGIDGLIVASPGNPTGSMLAPDQLEALCDYCERNGIRFFSDEIYHGIVFDNQTPQTTACSISDEAIVINSFSKYYSMAGWRLGWMVVPDYLVESLSNLAHNLYLSPPGPAQVGALHALDCRAELDHHVERYRRNRDLLLSRLPALGFDRYTAPHGAFYFYCHVAHLHRSSLDFCIEMLERARVLISPGSDFCPVSGDHYVRFAYAGPTQDIEMALERIADWRT